MPRRRPAAKLPDQVHWLTVSDNSRGLLQCERLPAGAKPQQALHEEAARWASKGWQVDGDMNYGFCFIQLGAERRLIKLCRADPTTPSSAGHAFLAGAGSAGAGPGAK
jgi:hypothetical protein